MGDSPTDGGRLELLSEEHLNDISKRVKSVVHSGDGNDPCEDEIK